MGLDSNVEGISNDLGQNVAYVVSQSVDLGWSNNPNTTPTKDYENV